MLLGDADGAADAVATVVGSQPDWLAPPSEVELLTAVARDLVPAEYDDPGAAPCGDGFWGLPAEARGALWLTAGDGRPTSQVAQILSMAPTSVVSLVEVAEAAMGPDPATPGPADLDAIGADGLDGGHERLDELVAGPPDGSAAASHDDGVRHRLLAERLDRKHRWLPQRRRAR